MPASLPIADMTWPSGAASVRSLLSLGLKVPGVCALDPVGSMIGSADWSGTDSDLDLPSREAAGSAGSPDCCGVVGAGLGCAWPLDGEEIGEVPVGVDVAGAGAGTGAATVGVLAIGLAPPLSVTACLASAPGPRPAGMLGLLPAG